MADFRFGNYEISRGRTKHYATALGFLTIGLGLGALAALLVTPKTGKQVRKNVRRTYEDARDRVGTWGNRAGDIWEKGEEWAEAAREKGEEWAEAARRKAEPVARRFSKG
jgi:gas vesicle protein